MYLFWLAKNNKGKYRIQSYIWATNSETGYVGSSIFKYYPYDVLVSMCILSTLLAYLFWLTNNNKVK